MKGTIVASRYAKSIFELALENNSSDKIQNDMVLIADTFENSKELLNLVKNPIIHASKKSEIFKSIFNGKIEAMSLAFIELIIKNSREVILPQITISYQELYKKHNNIVDVIIISAIPLTSEVKNKILSKLKIKYQGTLEIIEKIDTSILGGFIVKIDGKQIDASVSSQLTNLKNVLLN